MFYSHGKFIVTQQDNVIQVEACGPFNHEAIEAYQQDVINIVKGMSGPWGQLVLMQQDCICTPLALEKLHQFTRLRKEIGLEAIALVFLDSETLSIVRDSVADFYDSLDINYQLFTQQKQAEKWLLAQIQRSPSEEYSYII